MTKVEIGNVPDKNPPDFEDTFPFIRRPDCATPCIVNLNISLQHNKSPVNPTLTGVNISAIPQKWPLALTLKNR